MWLQGMVRLWIFNAVFWNVAGWLLSACGQLNAKGYAATLLLGFGGLFVYQRAHPGSAAFRWRKVVHRFRKTLPALFAISALLALLGGLLHPPNSGDSLQYRIPRMLHWWSHSGWYWIPTLDARLNTRPAGFEWLGMPLLVFTRTDRWLFFPSFVSLLFLPGLIYSLFIRLRVPRRLAWHWMWLLPTGYIYLTHAGSTQNDLFSVPFSLGSVLFALRAAETKRAGDAFAAFFCVCLLTSAKSSNLPLILPGLIALCRVWRVFIMRPALSLCVFLLGLLISFAPTAFFNAKYVGDWTGYSAERRIFMATDPVIAIIGNVFMIAVQNLVPPLFPFAIWWNRHALQIFPEGLRQKLLVNLEDGFWEVREIVAEERAGLGFGVILLLLVSVVAGFCIRCRNRRPLTAFERLLHLSPYLSLFGYMAKCGVNAGARLISPYYILLFPALLRIGNQTALTRRGWWQRCALGVFLLGFVVLVTIPTRPLWPAQTLLAWELRKRPDNPLLVRAKDVYALFARRNDGMAPLRQYLPSGTRNIGAISYLPDAITSMWKPFGSRSIQYILPGDTRESILRKGIQYIVVRNDLVPRFFGQSFDEWLRSVGGEVVGRESLYLYFWSEGERDWSVVRLEKSAQRE